MKLKLLLALTSFLLMLHLPMLVKMPDGTPYLVVEDKFRFQQITYTNPYHELLKKLSNRGKAQEETYTVFARQDDQGNMHFSDKPETSFHESQTYKVQTQSSGRIAFASYSVWGAMLSVWIVIYITLALIVHAFNYLLLKQPQSGSPISRAQAANNNTSSTPDKEPPHQQRLSPYQVLGINEGASAEQIKAAYRKQMADYHPDRVAHLGKELQDVARKKAVEINHAYENLLSR
jgi:hypothetical protein